ncbi:MAG: HNH endonuclease, partial [Acidimicrobiales bacterium]
NLSIEAADEAERRFHYRLTRQRLDQATFRVKVLTAYRTTCAMCRLRHGEFLDAAHIVPHAEQGPSTVTNGLALCKIHHAAYDRDIVGVRPDRVIRLRNDLLDETDGPMLRDGLQGLSPRAANPTDPPPSSSSAAGSGS